MELWAGGGVSGAQGGALQKRRLGRTLLPVVPMLPNPCHPCLCTFFSPYQGSKYLNGVEPWTATSASQVRYLSPRTFGGFPERPKVRNSPFPCPCPCPKSPPPPKQLPLHSPPPFSIHHAYFLFYPYLTFHLCRPALGRCARHLASAHPPNPLTFRASSLQRNCCLV